MLTVGVDLAAEPVRTAVAWIDWSAADASVRELVVDVDDDRIVAAVRTADKAGVDCPLGWPELFVEFVSQHAAGHVPIPEDVAGKDWRRRLAFRQTDLTVRRETGLVPLSVAADRIGHTAMRCAGLMARLAGEGLPVDRCGGGVVVEVYPAASLLRWGLLHRGYKRQGGGDGRASIVDGLLATAPWLSLGRFEEMCRTSDDALDAVVAALTARAASQGQATRPDAVQAATARTEGWIALPTGSLADLAP